MNGKKAKQIRRMAETLTVGKPNTKYNVRKYDAMGKQIPTTLVKGCTRQLYQAIKRA